MKLLFVFCALTAFCLGSVYPSIAKSERVKQNGTGTYLFSEPDLPGEVRFHAPASWKFERRTPPRRNLYRDGDVYNFRLASAHPSREKETIRVTLSRASGAEIALLKKGKIRRKPLVLADGRRCMLDTFRSSRGTVAENVWIRMNGEWLLVSIEASAQVTNHYQKDIQRLIHGITFVPKKPDDNERAHSRQAG